MPSYTQTYQYHVSAQRRPQQAQEYKKGDEICILFQSGCITIEIVLVSGIWPRIGVLPECGEAVNRRIVSVTPSWGPCSVLFFDSIHLQPAGRGPMALEVALAIHSGFVALKSALLPVHSSHQPVKV